MVAVAAQGVHGVGLPQLHEITQEAQALLPFFKQVSHQDEHIFRGKFGFFQYATKKGQVSVDIADGQHPSARGNVRP